MLRLGAHQLLSMRVPDHAAISTSVDLVRATVGQGPSGLVNAVLRKISRRDLDDWVAEVAPDRADRPPRPPRRRPVPPPLGRRRAGRGAGASGRTTSSRRCWPPTTPRRGSPWSPVPAWPTVDELEAAGGTRTGRSPYGVVLWRVATRRRVPAVAEGRAGVQDEGSQLVALAMADARLDGRDERWLDLCAGPGGKAALLAALAAQRGAVLVANERQPHRAALVASALRAVPAGAAHVLAGDGTRPPWVPGTFDRVLVDAPCSGLGALRRRPESRWRRTPEDVDGLVGTPAGAARRGARLGAPGRRRGLRDLLARASRRRREVVAAVLGRRGDTDEVDRFQLWPHRDGTDAMFAATLRRRALTRHARRRQSSCRWRR